MVFEKKTVIGLLRAFPAIMVYGFSIIGIILLNKRMLIFSAILLITDLFNWILKEYLFRPIYLTRKKLPLIGVGERPIGATFCGSFISPDDFGKKSSSFGMPSGHAQMAALVVTYWSLYFYNEHYENPTDCILPILFLVFIGLLVVWSRIYLKCHTLGQVIVGSTLGISLGYISYFISVNYQA